MGVTLTSYAQYGNASLTVTNSAELKAAITQLAGSNGGTIKVDPNGGPYNLTLNGVGSSKAPVLIESGGGGMAHFESITLTNSSFIAFDGVDVDTSHNVGQPKYVDDLRIENSSHIEIANSNFTGSAQGYLDGSGGGTVGNTGAYIVRSDNILLDNNVFSNHFYGLKVVDTKGLVFEDNEVTQFQADGFHGGGLQDAQIVNNHLHNALGSVQSMVHSDFIQIRAAATAFQNSNVEIAGNLIDSSSGGGAQGIHMGAGGTGARFTDISIHDNVIHTALPHGVGVSNIDNLEVYNNTVLWNEATSVIASPGAAPNSWDARIIVNNSPSAQVYDNISSWIRINGSHDPNGGYQIVYDDPNAANYVGKHFVNVDGSGNPNSYDLNLLKGSALYGDYGAAMSSGGTATTTGTGTAGVSGSATTTYSAPPAPSSETTSGTSEGSGSSGESEGSSTPATTEISGSETPTVINGDIEAPSEPVYSGGETSSSSGETSTSSGESSSSASESSPTSSTTSGEAEGSEGAADDTGGSAVPRGQAKKAARQEEQGDEDSSNLLTKFFSLIFGGDDDSSNDAETAAPKGNGRWSKQSNDGLEDVVPVTEWLDETGTSSTSSEEEEEDDTMLAA